VEKGDREDKVGTPVTTSWEKDDSASLWISGKIVCRYNLQKARCANRHHRSGPRGWDGTQKGESHRTTERRWGKGVYGGIWGGVSGVTFQKADIKLVRLSRRKKRVCYHFL